MNNVYNFLLVILAFSFIANSSMSGSTNDYQIPNKVLIGINAAEENLSEFINSNINSTSSMLSKNDCTDIASRSFTSIETVRYPAKIQYEFSTNQSKYDVNAVSGQVEGFLSYLPIVGDNAYTLYQGEKIAKNYASRLYPEFSNKTLKLCEKSSMNSFNSTILLYSWCEYKNGVRTPNGISIWISAVTSELVSFNIYDNPIQISDISPKISSDLAVSKIKAKYNSLEKIDEISPILAIEYMNYDKQQLVWEISVKGEEGTGLWKTRIWTTEYVDAMSGEILSPPPLPVFEETV